MDLQIPRAASAATWAEVNYTLDKGEFGLEIDTGKFKVGDGSHPWSELPYFIPGAGKLSELSDVDLTGLADADILVYNEGTEKWEPGPAGTAGGSSSEIFDVTAAATVDVTGLDPTKQYEFSIEGELDQGGVTRWIGLFPNGTPGANSAGNYMRTDLERSWTAADGSVSAPQQGFFIEHGFVLGAIPYTDDQVISAKARVGLATGRPRIAYGEMNTGSIDGTLVNEVSLHRAVSKWADTTTDITHMVVDFGGGTFTGRVVVTPSESTGAAPVTVPSDWQDLVFDNSWGNIGDPYETAQWRQVGDEIELRGAITKASGSAAGQQIAHGAPGPLKQFYRRVASVAGDSTIEVYTDGSIHVAGTAFAAGDLSLNGIRYPMT